MNRIRLTLVAAFLLWTNCSSSGGLNVTTSFDQAVDFASYRTYAWMTLENPRVQDPAAASPAMDAHIRATIEEQLAAKGVSRIESGDPDFVVGYLAALRTNLDVTTLSNVFGYREGGTWVQDPSLTEYRRGSLIVAFVAPGTREVTWRGSAQTELDEASVGDPAAVQATVTDAIQKILARYPPR